MNSRILVIGLISIVVFGSFLIGGQKKDTPFLKTETKQAGAVEIEATPIQLETGKEAIIELSLNTHSVELDYDYTEISYLEDNLGNKYKALKWSGEKGGHHLGGTLTFEKLEKNAQIATLMILGIENEDIFFEWEL